MLNKLHRPLILSLAFLLVLTLASTTVFADNTPVPENSSRLQVSGSAVITATPDLAQVFLGVRTADASAEQAAQENAQLMDNVLAALQALGISAEQISTSNYNIYSYTQIIDRNTKDEAAVTTYEVQNRITVSTTQLAEVGKIVDSAVKAGANEVQGIQFDLVDKQELQLKALQGAITQAQAKAEAMAESAGITLGGIATLNEDYGTYAPATERLVMKAQAMGAADTVINPGEIGVSANVTLVFWF